ncbi:MAG: hypothetical protein MUE39_10345 [Gammaproteobacteria bacterium]|nr:hypothetical protein [Gammaproteobacteria bacterium]
MDDYLRAAFGILKQMVSLGTDIASASTITLPNDGQVFRVTGTTTITGIAASWNGRAALLRFDGALQLTHNASNFSLPGAANITTAAGDWALFVQTASGVWRCAQYQPAGASLAGGTVTGAINFTGTLTKNGVAVDALPSTTAMMFAQAAAPTGWTKSATHNDKTLRVVSGSGGGSGGSVAFSTLFARTATDAHTLTEAQLPAHAHDAGTYSAASAGAHTHNVVASSGSLVMSGAGGASAFAAGTGASNQAATAQSNGAHTHTVSGSSSSVGSGSAHSHNIDMQVQYVDVIIATKN